jgi:hypothetical protein
MEAICSFETSVFTGTTLRYTLSEDSILQIVCLFSALLNYITIEENSYETVCRGYLTQFIAHDFILFENQIIR